MSNSRLPFGFDQPDDSPGFLLWQVTTLWQRNIKKILDPHDISHAQFVIMATVLWFSEHDYDTTQTAIVNWSKLDKMTVSKALKKLSGCGYIIRQEHSKDTRAKSVILTEAGKQKIHTLVPLIEKMDECFFSLFSEENHSQLISLLKRLSFSPLLSFI